MRDLWQQETTLASPEFHRIREIIASRRISSDRPVNLEKFRANIEATARALPDDVNGTMIDAGGVPAELKWRRTLQRKTSSFISMAAAT